MYVYVYVCIYIYRERDYVSIYLSIRPSIHPGQARRRRAAHDAQVPRVPRGRGGPR